MDNDELLTLKLAAAIRLATPHNPHTPPPTDKDFINIAKSLILILPALKITLTQGPQP